ncbi:Thymidylate kinase [Candidatus Burarchaeum australiense]|nr:Thymidylate kinase [Candidatus Burarchaeum australiense]
MIGIYISISGVHGIGKSLVARMLAKRNGWEFSPEVVDTVIRPPRFGPRSREKLLAELWHMRQLMQREEWLAKNRDKVCITDRWWQDVVVYGKVLLSPKEFRIVENVVSWIPKETPDLEIVLWAPDDNVFTKVGERGRDKGVTWGEKDLSYLRQVNTGFRSYYDSFKDIRNISLVEAQPVIEGSYALVKRIVSRYVKDVKQRTLDEFRS